jgi:general secretion pathway protein J
MRNRRTRETGFTLLEVLVAVGIFALFSAMAYGGLLHMLDTRDRLETEREFWRGLGLSFVQMADDLSQARERTIRDAYGNPLPALRGQPVDSRALGEPSLEFTRGGRTVLGNVAYSDLQRIGYRLRDGSLWRLTWPALDRPPASEPHEQLLLEHVDDLRLRFYAPGGGWVDQWPAVNQPPDNLRNLPGAVEMTLTITGRGQFVRLFRVNG